MPTTTQRSRTRTRDQVAAVGYAASYTPNPLMPGRKIITLTGNITIANPSAVGRYVGCPLSFLFIQDATGGRTVTWGSDFQVNWTPTTTANKRNSIDFVWDGAKWAQVAEKVNV